MIEVLILSIIQGVTEFLPISSSSHLILVSEFLEFENQKLEVDVSLHICSFFAVIVYFRKDILNFFNMFISGSLSQQPLFFFCSSKSLEPGYLG